MNRQYELQPMIDSLKAQIENFSSTIVSSIPAITEPVINTIKPDILPNTLNQLGEQIAKPQNSGLILVAGLVAAALILK